MQNITHFDTISKHLSLTLLKHNINYDTIFLNVINLFERLNKTYIINSHDPNDDMLYNIFIDKYNYDTIHGKILIKTLMETGICNPNNHINLREVYMYIL